MTTTEVATPTCEARSGFYPGEWSEMPVFCQATTALTTWTDRSGFTHRACRHHVGALRKRYPVYVSENFDDPLGQAKAAADRRYERTGFDPDGLYGSAACHKAGHIDGCPGKAGGEHELLPGWISFEDDGVTVEVEVSDA